MWSWIINAQNILIWDSHFKLWVGSALSDRFSSQVITFPHSKLDPWCSTEIRQIQILTKFWISFLASIIRASSGVNFGLFYIEIRGRWPSQRHSADFTENFNQTEIFLKPSLLKTFNSLQQIIVVTHFSQFPKRSWSWRKLHWLMSLLLTFKMTVKPCQVALTVQCRVIIDCSYLERM